jgi:hypothetical protein
MKIEQENPVFFFKLGKLLGTPHGRHKYILLLLVTVYCFGSTLFDFKAIKLSFHLSLCLFVCPFIYLRVQPWLALDGFL